MYRKILIIVDAQNDFITRALGTKEADAAVPNIVDLIKRFCWEEIICTMDTHTSILWKERNFLLNIVLRQAWAGVWIPES